MLRSDRLPHLLALALALSATGCGKVREIRACRGLSHEVNPALDQIESLSKSKDPERALRIAGAYAALAKRLAPRAQGSTPLANAVRDYAAVLTSTEVALRAHAEAVRSNNNARIAETRRDLERIVKRERAAVARISVECHV